MATQRGSSTHKASTGGHFEMSIDGATSTAYLKAVDGGSVKTAVIDEPIGPENHHIKHTSVASIDPISVELGLSGTDAILKWIQMSWKKQYARHNGEIRHANFDLYETATIEFYDALITETQFPTLDGASKDAAYLKVKIQPERTIMKKTSGGRVQSNMSPKQKLWLCSGFRLKIDGVDNVEYTNKIDGFTIKQGTKALYTGADRLPQIEPTKIEFPHITGTIALGYADALIKWHQKYVVDGAMDPKQQKTGSLEFLAPDRSQVLFRINLFEVGIFGLSMMASTANQEAIKRMKFELYVGRMELDGPAGLAFG